MVNNYTVLSSEVYVMEKSDYTCFFTKQDTIPEIFM